MNCASVENLLDLYQDGRLAAFQARWVERHLAACPACAARLEAARRLSSALRALPVPPLPEDLARSIKAAVASAPEEDRESEPLAELFPARTPSLALALGFLAFILSLSGSLLGPGIPSQVCADGTQQVCAMGSGDSFGR